MSLIWESELSVSESNSVDSSVNSTEISSTELSELYSSSREIEDILSQEQSESESVQYSSVIFNVVDFH